MSERVRIDRYFGREFLYPVRDPLWSHIYLSRGLRAIAASPEFQLLKGIKQLGPTHLVYPGATHTRLSHSLGVLELAKRTLGALLQSADLGFVTLEGVKAFLAAALLHDLGHFPYAHSLKELPLKSHERLTAEIIMDSSLEKTIRNHLGADPRMVAAIVDLRMPHEERDELRLFRSILSGVLDPDKLDYLNRDAFFCGVSYGIQDIDFVLSKLRYDRSVGLMLGIDGLTAVENVLFSKYLMYRAVYWHRTVRSATAMIKKAVHTAVRDGTLRACDLYRIDDEDFARTFSAKDYPPFGLIDKVSRGELHALAFEAPVAAVLGALPELATLDGRTRLERDIAATLGRRRTNGVSAESIILDVPEPISFEADLMIDSDAGIVPFPDSGTVFDRAVIAGFSRTLRKLRLFVEPAVMHDIDDPAGLLGVRPGDE